MTKYFDYTGKKLTDLNLPKEVFGAPVNESLMAQALYVYQSNQTQGTKRAKTRGEVNLTKAKVYRQKGTGNARHGAKSAPIYVGGGQAHGPKGILASRKQLNTKMRRLSLISAFSQLAKNNAITVIKDLGKTSTKTKDLVTLLNKLEADKKALLLTNESHTHLLPGAKNIKNLKLSRYNLTNIYDLLNSKNLLLDESSINPIIKWLTGKELTSKVAASAPKKAKVATTPAKKVTKKSTPKK